MNGTPAGESTEGAARVSVVIVSRDRPQALARCFAGVAQLYYHPFEVVVVADPPGCAAVRATPQAERIKLVPFDEANISAARNAGIAAAGGEIIAFIDDDAVPEPTWLDHLVAPIARGQAEVAGGFVLGRNGISFQWRARWVDSAGVAHSLPVPGDAPFRPEAPPGGAIKTEGTNMAVRRDVLAALGGFDSRIHFYLDETELNLRLSREGARTWLVPLAQVHHGFAASPRRRADRVPRSLFDIGASSEVFWAAHTPPEAVEPAREALVAGQRRRMLGHMVRGSAEPRDVGRLLRTLHEGLTEGRARAAVAPRRAVLNDCPDFRPLFPTRPSGGMHFLAGRVSETARLMDEARVLRSKGGRVTLTLLSCGFRRHNVRFTGEGLWVQKGGRAGLSDRNTRIPLRIDHKTRLIGEIRRVIPVRENPRFPMAQDVIRTLSTG